MIRLKSHTPGIISKRIEPYLKARYLLSYSSRKSNLSAKDHPQRDDASEQATRSRLMKVSEILKEENSFQKTSSRINQLYSRGNTRMFEDLRSSLHQKTHIARELCRGFTQSRSMRGLYLNQLFKCIANKEYSAFSTGVKIMERSGLLNVYERLLIMEIESATLNKRDKQEPLGKTSECLELLILIAITSGEPLVGASFALNMSKLSVQIKTETLERLISVLSINDPLLHNYHSFAIFKLLSTYEREFSPKVLLAAIQNMASSSNPYFANLLHDKYEKNYQVNSSVSESLVKTRKSLIRANLEHGNYYRAATLWKMNKKSDPTFAEKNTLLFQSLLEKTPDEKIVEDLLLNYFPTLLYSDVNFVDFGLNYFGQREKYRSYFEHVTKSLKPPLKRNTLSSLFSAFIYQDREEASEKILQVILKTKNGLNSEDFLVIINKLLGKGQIRKCVEMCLVNDFRVSYKGSMKVMEYLLTHPKPTETAKVDSGSHESYNKLKKKFMEKLVRDLYKKTNDKSVYRLFTITIFNYFSAHINNRSSRKLFSNMTYSINKAENEAVNFSSYDVPSEFGKFLLVDIGNRLQCLEIILKRAQKEKDRTLIAWCVSELQMNGILVTDIEEYYLGSSH